MAPEIKSNCERCNKELPPDSDEATICSYECTYCANCSLELKRVCSNCKGELVERTRREASFFLTNNCSVK